MHKENCTIILPGNGNYAITLPGQISYVLEATSEELDIARKEILASYIYEEDFCVQNSTSLAVIPTFDCNLRCVYCYSKGGETKKTIQLDYIKQALDYKRKSNPNVDWLDLYLVGGGEPLLDFEIVKSIVSLSKEFFDKVQMHIVSNGTFDDEICNWLIANEVDIRISYDCIAQQYQRKYANGESSVSIVENTIKKLVSAGINPLLQTIITSDSISLMKENVLKAVELGVHIIKMEPALSSAISRAKKSLEPNPVEFAINLLEVVKFIAQNNLPIQIDTGFFTKPAIGSYCGMSLGNFTITPDGIITSCVEVAKNSDPYVNQVSIGTISKNGLSLNQKNINGLKIFDYRHQLGGCSNCELRMICLGGCPMSNIWKNGFPLRKSNFTCAVEHNLIPNLLLMMAENEAIFNIMMENPIIS